LSSNPAIPPSRSKLVDGIPVLWLDSTAGATVRCLAIALPGLSGTKESMVTPFLEDLAARGFVALSFDPWQHGERGTEGREQLSRRVFSNFRGNFWPILGHTVLDTMRVIDWAVATLHVTPPVLMIGTSMGGDIAVAAAGMDHRIERVATVVSTPDWLRPGMQLKPGIAAPPGEPDDQAQAFYDRLNPLTHLEAYAHCPAISFVCGEQDSHVPPDGASRFQKVLRDRYPDCAKNVRVKIVPGKGHADFIDPGLWWPESLAWLSLAPGMTRGN
jgi:dienelactone hydrolase